jgi:hypothetical protein
MLKNMIGPAIICFAICGYAEEPKNKPPFPAKLSELNFTKLKLAQARAQQAMAQVNAEIGALEKQVQDIKSARSQPELLAPKPETLRTTKK